MNSEQIYLENTSVFQPEVHSFDSIVQSLGYCLILSILFSLEDAQFRWPQSLPVQILMITNSHFSSKIVGVKNGNYKVDNLQVEAKGDIRLSPANTFKNDIHSWANLL